MRYIIFSILIISILISTSCARTNQNSQNQVKAVEIIGEHVNKQASPTPQKTGTKLLINFFSLANKPASEIEKIYGKPSLIDTKFVQFKNGEYRIYDKSGERFLQVDYYQGKAVAFYLDIPKASQTKQPEEAVGLCGFNLDISSAMVEAEGFWWDNPPSAKPFYNVRVRRFNDSGLYYTCEAHIKI
jgi:hypothetical protein